MITKFEAVGIFACVLLMSAALFLLRIDGSSVELVDEAATSQTAAVIVSDGENVNQERANALATSLSANETALVIDDVTLGTGEEAVPGSDVEVHYIGRLENGQEFDNSYKRGETIRFTLGEGEVIAGWEQGVVGMREGGQRILVVPPELAYGNRQVGPIPRNATLLFVVELVAIN